MSQNIPRPPYQTTILQPVNNPPPHPRYVPGPPMNYNRPPGRSFHIRGDPRFIQRPPRPPQGPPRHGLPPGQKDPNELVSKEDLSRLAKDIDQSSLLEDDVIDVKLCLSQQYDLQVPGFSVEKDNKKQHTGE